MWRVTARDAERRQARAAGALRAQGIEPGERVALTLPSSPDLLALIIGALRIGVVPVPLNPALIAGERQVLLEDCEPALVLDDADALGALIDSANETELADHPLARPMHFTSGTTGRPKGVWSGMLDDAGAQALFEDERDLWELGRDDVLLVCSPLHHSAPIRFATGVLLSGGDLVLLERFDASAVASALVDHAVTAAFMVPSHLQRLARTGIAAAELTSFRLLAHAGEPCAEALKRWALDAFPSGSVWEFYGSTEGQFTVCSPDEWLEHPGTVGRARPHRAIEIDGEGGVWCHAPPWARFTYWRDAAKTAAVWRGDAFTVGDLGRLDEAGYLFLDGRRDDLIISGGVNVYPAEVEAALAGVDGVHEVAVFGVPDERWGQRVCVALVGDADDEALYAAAGRRLAAYKQPKDVYRVAELPRTGSGKIRRSAIAEALGLV